MTPTNPIHHAMYKTSDPTCITLLPHTPSLCCLLTLLLQLSNVRSRVLSQRRPLTQLHRIKRCSPEVDCDTHLRRVPSPDLWRARLMQMVPEHHGCAVVRRAHRNSPQKVPEGSSCR
jgi:hypothetical protein